MPGPLEPTRPRVMATLSLDERFQRMCGQSMEQCEAILDEPIDVAIRNRDAVILNTKMQVIRAVFQIAGKMGVDLQRHLSREREVVLERLAREMRE